MDILKEKCYPLYIFVDSLDEMNLPQAIGRMLEEERKLPKSPKKLVDDQIDIMKYIIKFLNGKDTALVTLFELIKELDIREINGIDINSLLINMSDFNEKEE